MPSPNPKGRPKGETLSSILRKMIDEPAARVEKIARVAVALGLEPQATTIGSVIALRLLTEGVQGNAPAIRELLDRLEGKPATIIAEAIAPENLLAWVKAEAEKIGD